MIKKIEELKRRARIESLQGNIILATRLFMLAFELEDKIKDMIYEKGKEDERKNQY